MAGDDVRRLLEQLSTSARELHEETESIGSVIQEVEQKLRTMDLGIEAWLTDDPLWSHELSVSASNVAPRRELQLGFAPLKSAKNPTSKDWRLQLREADVTESAGVAPGDESGGARIQSQVPLELGSREDQVRALKRLPKMLEHLVELAQDRIETIREARNLLE